MKWVLLIILFAAVVNFVIWDYSIPLPGREKSFCYEGSKDPNCDIYLTEEEAAAMVAERVAKDKAIEAEFNRNNRCKQDSDCAVVGKNIGREMCGIKGSDAAKNLGESDNSGNCKCMNGPVIFGCFTNQEYKSWQKSSTQ